MGLQDLLDMLARRWPIIVIAALLGAVLAVAATYFMTPMYEASALIRCSS